MALTGKFFADFSSFYDAVKQADVSLNGFQQNAAKVEQALDRATNAFSGQKLIQQATIAVEAVSRLSDEGNALAGVMKLTATEQERLNRQLTEAIAKYTALGETAPKEMLELQQATAAAVKETERLKKEAAEGDKGGAASKWISDFTSSLTGMAAGLISAQAVIGGFRSAWGALVSFVGSSIESFAGAEAAEKQMTVALANLGQATPRATAYMADLAAQFQDTTKYSDDLINQMQALLMQVGTVLPSEMEGALTAATDLASGLGIELKDATNVVAKAFEGNVGALKRYGVAIDEAKFAAEGMPYVLDEINKRFGGQAAAELDTYAGRLQHLANNWDNVKESVGKNILSSPILEAALRMLDEAAVRAAEAGGTAEATWSGFAKSLGLFSAAHAIGDLERLAGAYNDAAWARDQFKEKKPSENESILLGSAEDRARMAAVVAASLKEGIELNKQKADTDRQAAQAAQQHANAVSSLRDALGGDGAIKQGQLYVEALAGVKDLSVLTAEAQKQIADAMWKAIEAYRVQGKEVPPIIADISTKLSLMPPSIAEGTAGLERMGEAVRIAATDYAKLFAQVQTTGEKAEAANKKFYETIDKEMAAAYAEAGKNSGAFFEKQESGFATATASAQQYAVTIQNISSAQYEALAKGAEFDAAYNRTHGGGGAFFSSASQASMQEQAARKYQELAGMTKQREEFVGGGQAWGRSNTLNVNVNSTDAQNIAGKLVNEMRYQGVRF